MEMSDLGGFSRHIGIREVPCGRFSAIAARRGDCGQAGKAQLVPRFGPIRAYLCRYDHTYYCCTLEEALRRAKKAGKEPGCFFGGITLKSGKTGFAVYREGKEVERYSVIGRG